MSVWPTDPPASDLDEPYPWDEEEPAEDEAPEPPCEACGGPCRCVVDFAGPSDGLFGVAVEDVDYDGPGWPF